MIVYSSTPTLSSTVVSNVSPTFAVADWSGDAVRTTMTLPAGSTTRDWAGASCAGASDQKPSSSAALHAPVRRTTAVLQCSMMTSQLSSLNPAGVSYSRDGPNHNHGRVDPTRPAHPA